MLDRRKPDGEDASPGEGDGGRTISPLSPLLLLAPLTLLPRANSSLADGDDVAAAIAAVADRPAARIALDGANRSPPLPPLPMLLRKLRDGRCQLLGVGAFALGESGFSAGDCGRGPGTESCHVMDF
ncbi:unnamed protein product [Closterium sp. NIES-54]